MPAGNGCSCWKARPRSSAASSPSSICRNGPKDAKWLTAPERNIIVPALEAEEATHRAMGHGHRLIDALTSGKVWLLAVTNFSLLGGIYGISFWMPQIVKDLGVKDLFLNGVVTSIPFAVACVFMIVVGRSSDRTRERKWHIVLSGAVGALGLVGGATLTATPALALACISLGLGGALASIVVLWVCRARCSRALRMPAASR